MVHDPRPGIAHGFLRCLVPYARRQVLWAWQGEDDAGEERDVMDEERQAPVEPAAGAAPMAAHFPLGVCTRAELPVGRQQRQHLMGIWQLIQESSLVQ